MVNMARTSEYVPTIAWTAALERVRSHEDQERTNDQERTWLRNEVLRTSQVSTNERSRGDDPLAFAHGNDLIRADVGDRLHHAARPPDLELLRARAVGQAEVDARIALS